MFDKLKVIFDLFRVGGELHNAVVAKNMQNLGNAVAALLLLAVNMAKWAGVEIPLDETTALYVAGGLVAAYNVVLTTISSRKVGLLPAKAGDAAGPSNAGGGQGLPGVQTPVADQSVQPVSGTGNSPTDIYRG